MEEKENEITSTIVGEKNKNRTKNRANALVLVPNEQKMCLGKNRGAQNKMLSSFSKIGTPPPE